MLFRSLRGLEAGEWKLEVQADGYLPAEEWVEVGPDSPEVAIELRRTGRVRGVVVDSAHNPVAGAWVGDASAAFTVQFFGHLGDVTRADGSFAIEVDVARPRLIAMAKGFAPSEAVEVQSSADGVEGLVLELRSECSVEGRVLAEDGTPVARARLDPRVLHRPRIAADAAGRLRAGGLAPGPIELVATHPAGDEKGVGSASAVLVPGQSTRVEIRFRAEDPVRLTVALTRGGRPFAGQSMWRSLTHVQASFSHDPGTLEVTLPHPGRWGGVIWAQDEVPDWRDLSRVDVRRFEVLVPDVATHVLELRVDELPRVQAQDELSEFFFR